MQTAELLLISLCVLFLGVVAFYIACRVGTRAVLRTLAEFMKEKKDHGKE